MLFLSDVSLILYTGDSCREQDCYYEGGGGLNIQKTIVLHEQVCNQARLIGKQNPLAYNFH